jgi:hypothetical protein
LVVAPSLRHAFNAKHSFQPWLVAFQIDIDG